MIEGEQIFNPPPGWPPAPSGWKPPAGWTPPESWASPPEGWQLWLPVDAEIGPLSDSPADPEAEAADPSNGASPPVQGDGVASEVQRLKDENAQLRRQLDAVGADGLVPLDDRRVLQDVGIYRYHHPLENAIAYQDRLREIENQIVSLVDRDMAIERSNMFTFDNSLAKGRKMSSDLSRLMLRAYNAEADNCLRSLRAGNVTTSKSRLQHSRDAIARLGQIMQMRISDEFHGLRVEELELTADWLMRKQDEKEVEREERARLREERRVEQELAEQRVRLDKERALLVQTLQALSAAGAVDESLSTRLAEVEQAISDNDYRAANIRAGYVYVISNRGAFGEDVVKIGLTRRLDPRDRINELSGASVPFRFDVHTIYFSEDAVTLEAELHQHFAARALNQANRRKEFFFATPGEVRDALASKVGNLLEFAEQADATEYFQSRGSWPTHAAPDADLAQL